MCKDGKKPHWHTADGASYQLLKENAKKNRREMTEAESAFWSLVSGSALGQKCRRQYVIGDYIVDFFFRKSMLVIELDGEYHFTDDQIKEDRIRQEWLEDNGYTVIRFTNQQVLVDPQYVINIVKDNLINH